MKTANCYHTAKKIAVIGGGTSGLASCYYLLEQLNDPSQHYEIHLFEKEQYLGGNVHTAIVKLGESQTLSVLEGEKPYTKQLVRWADLGVNDINLSMYITLKDVMLNTGYLSPETINGPFDGASPTQSNLKPLEDGACFFSSDNSLLYTDDNNIPTNRAIDRRFSLQDVSACGDLLPTPLGFVFDSLIEFGVNLTPDELEAAWNIPSYVFFDILIERARHFSQCGETEHKLGILNNCVDRLIEFFNAESFVGDYLAELIKTARDNLFYPRVAAMFFTSDKGPELLPLAAPFGYFKYQEGVGTSGDKTPDRRYFYGGARTWIEYLERYLTAQYDKTSNLSLYIHTNTPVKLLVKEGGFILQDYEVEQDEPLAFNGVISTIHADQARNNILFEGNHAQQGNRLAPILGRINYTQSVGVVHTDASVISSNVNSWRTFNIAIRHGETMLPYNMTFQENRHQNDWQNSNIKHAPELSFFTTLNPTQPIAEKFVLNTVDCDMDEVNDETDLEFICGTLFAHLPIATQEQFKASHSNKLFHRADKQAKTYFRHNVYDKAAHISQQEIQAYHQELPDLVKRNYAPITFAGSWCAEVGLQETCWKQAKVATECLIAALKQIELNERDTLDKKDI